MSKPKQEVWIDVKFTETHTDSVITAGSISQPVEGTNISNLRSKLKEALDKLLIGYSMAYGATITIRIAKAETDEFANPER